MTPEKPQQPGEDPVRHHVFDGIAEYDRRLPNWWLLTFYGAIVFAIFYWLDTQIFARTTDEKELQRDLARIEAVRLADAGAPRDDASLWKMSRNPVFVQAGGSTYKSTCASCHGENLGGGVGANLVDNVWIHGNRPLDVLNTVENGFAPKGMPAWGSMLGTKKINEVVAFILSHHTAPVGAE
jgi:cytochrome c oxidase cbb3-type subunit III